MLLDTAIYPTIPLPFRLRMLQLLNCIVQFSAFSADEELTSYALEREFKALISRRNATISKICFAFAGSVAEFDDLRQDTLINIWRGLKHFRGEATEKTWIYRVTVNSCISTVRSQSRHKHDSLEGLYGLVDNDDTDKDTIELIHRAIATLGSEDKAIIMMWLDELSYDDIASALGLNRNTVATRIRRIKDKIANVYKKDL